MKIIRIISGGQTGADRAGLDAAIEAGIPYDGWCPKGRRAEDGIIPEQYILKETSAFGYMPRTKMNVTCSSATLVFTFGKANGGSFRTIGSAGALMKPCLHLNLFQAVDEVVADKIYAWLNKNFGDQEVVLNIAGSRESSRPGVGEHTSL